MSAYADQIAQLQRNADALIVRAKQDMVREFALIDRAADIRARNKSKPHIALAAPSIHDLCANNPALRKLIRDMQR